MAFALASMIWGPGAGQDLPSCGREPALLCLAALSLQVRWAVEWVRRCGEDPGLAQIFDARAPEAGLPGGAYARLRERLLEDMRRLGVSPRRGRVVPLAARLPAGEASKWKPWTGGWVKEDAFKTRSFDLVGALERAESGALRAMAVEDFRRSWRRPKWDFIQQELSGGMP